MGLFRVAAVGQEPRRHVKNQRRRATERLYGAEVQSAVRNAGVINRIGGPQILKIEREIWVYIPAGQMSCRLKTKPGRRRASSTGGRPKHSPALLLFRWEFIQGRGVWYTKGAEAVPGMARGNPGRRKKRGLPCPTVESLQTLTGKPRCTWGLPVMIAVRSVVVLQKTG